MRLGPVVWTAAVLLGEVLGGAGASRAADPWVDPLPELAIDRKVLDAAIERGTALLKEARWSAPVGMTEGQLYDAGDWAIWCSGYAAVAINKATGKQIWQLAP